MPKARRNTPQRKGDTAATLGYEAQLWQMADALRGSMDAAEYKHFVLGLIFLKYTSDAFDDRKTQIEAELEADGIPENGRAALLENRDEYTGRGVFWVPPAARWDRASARRTPG